MKINSPSLLLLSLTLSNLSVQAEDAPKAMVSPSNSTAPVKKVVKKDETKEKQPLYKDIADVADSAANKLRKNVKGPNKAGDEEGEKLNNLQVVKFT